jgi:hypothetical protein
MRGKSPRTLASPAQTRTGDPRKRSFTLLAARGARRGFGDAKWGRARRIENFLIDGRAAHHVNLKASEKRAE